MVSIALKMAVHFTIEDLLCHNPVERVNVCIITVEPQLLVKSPSQFSIQCKHFHVFMQTYFFQEFL